jgi:hypothetical protein
LRKKKNILFEELGEEFDSEGIGLFFLKREAEQK